MKIETKVNNFFSLLFNGLRFSRKVFFTFLFSFLILVSLLLPFRYSSAQSGVLVPSNDSKPNPKVLSLAVMNVEITIDNGRASVKIIQIFDNYSAQTLEGKYIFALPRQSSIADFAVWDNDTRIPGVMMQRRRVNQIYDSIKSQQIDPGILQQTDETESAAGFSAKIFPINSFGTKRLEMEYTEDLPIENLTAIFNFPLKPSYGEKQIVGDFSLKIRVLNEASFLPLNLDNSPFPLKITKSEPNEFSGEFRSQNVELNDDFSFSYRINSTENNFSVVAYRAPEKISAYDLRDPQLANQKPDGFFQAQAVFSPDTNMIKQPKRVVLLLDTSLSMYGDKLARAVEAIDFFLHGLSAEDEFNLILFNDETTFFNSRPQKASSEKIEKALEFIKHSGLGGGTNLKAAFESAVGQTPLFSDGEKQVILISDANPTLGTTQTKNIEQIFENQNIRLFAFAIGANSNEKLLESLSAKTRGYYETVRETEDIALKLKLFFDKVGTSNINNLRLAQDSNLYDIYASGDSSFFGSNFWELYLLHTLGRI